MRRFIQTLLLTVAGLAGAAATQAAPEHYAIDIDGQHAFIQFKIQHLGYSWLLGEFRTFDGHFTLDNEDITRSSVTVTVDTRSLDSNHAERDKHLKGPDFLDVSTHPEARFHSERIEAHGDGRFTIHGPLTLHGITRDIAIEAREIGQGPDPWGGYRAGFEGTTTLRLKDFGIDYDLGPASTHVQLNLYVEGVRQPAAD